MGQTPHVEHAQDPEKIAGTAVAAIGTDTSTRIERLLHNELSDIDKAGLLVEFRADPADAGRRAALTDAVADCLRHNPDFRTALTAALAVAAHPTGAELGTGQVAVSAGPGRPSPVWWILDAVVVLALSVTAWARLAGAEDSGFSPQVDTAVTVLSTVAGAGAVKASARERPGWAALGMFIATNTSLSPYPVLHLAAGALVIAELTRAVRRRRAR